MVREVLCLNQVPCPWLGLIIFKTGVVGMDFLSNRFFTGCMQQELMGDLDLGKYERRDAVPIGVNGFTWWSVVNFFCGH